MDFFSTEGFMPHGHCYLWTPGILWLHVISDALIVLSYYSIPLALIYFIRKRKDLVFNWVFRLFAAFIFWCGTTHLLAIWVTWNPSYWLDGSVKAVTAGVSVVTAIALWPLIPRALKYPSPGELQRMNEVLQEQIRERMRADVQLSELNQTLERRVGERTRDLEQFSYAVSHDLREPLRAMAGYAYLLKSRAAEGLDEEGLEFLENIIAGGGRMDKLITGLLSYARIGGGAIEPERVQLSEIVGEVLRDLGDLKQRTGAQVEVGELPRLTTRVPLVRQVLQNLLVNAMRYGAKEGEAPQITVSAHPEKAGWRIEVADAGPGIAPEQQARVFKIFQQLQRREGSEGTGMGLAISLKIVESLGGRLWVESDGRSGSRFCFTLVELPPDAPHGDSAQEGAS